MREKQTVRKSFDPKNWKKMQENAVSLSHAEAEDFLKERIEGEFSYTLRLASASFQGRRTLVRFCFRVFFHVGYGMQCLLL